MHIQAEIRGMSYRPLLCRERHAYSIEELEKAFEGDGAFTLHFDRDTAVAASWWVSPKRTRSYPYARIYDTLNFQGKRVTFIPILKDEGRDGDRDFLQWDTVSLMSLLGVYVIIGYYDRAERSERYPNKIARQRFNINHLLTHLNALLAYQSDALHWNLAQLDAIGETAQKALCAYEEISSRLGVPMHSPASAQRRIAILQRGKEAFVGLSRHLAQQAQERETVTLQPKERLKGTKATISIRNYLGGVYYLTCDETRREGDALYLIEGKHSARSGLPSLEDIKDGLVRMMLFCNLEKVQADGQAVRPVPVLKLTSSHAAPVEALTRAQRALLDTLQQEAVHNRFEVWLSQACLMGC